MHLVQNVCHMPIVDFCTEYIVYTRKNVVSVSGRFGPRNLNGMLCKYGCIFPHIIIVRCLCFKEVTVFAVRSAIRRLGCWSKFVAVRICGLKYVNVIHLL